MALDCCTMDTNGDQICSSPLIHTSKHRSSSYFRQTRPKCVRVPKIHAVRARGSLRGWATATLNQITTNSRVVGDTTGCLVELLPDWVIEAKQDIDATGTVERYVLPCHSYVIFFLLPVCLTRA